MNHESSLDYLQTGGWPLNFLPKKREKKHPNKKKTDSQTNSILFTIFNFSWLQINGFYKEQKRSFQLRIKKNEFSYRLR